ncbi:MAG: 2-oxoacid:acceptor oxidoreductase family protein [Armatimonadetes bacterium]|nr:2-oxoacid:acceptor oxidoreductase family protein [Armatimonadota bacterium]
MAQLVEVRWHGRGGQGAKTAGYILAVAAAEQGKKVQAFPEYGAERRGAPMRSYVRISDGPIRLRCAVRSPEVVVVLDDTLLESEDVASGVVEGGWVIVNTGATPAEAKARMGNPNVRVATVDATKISMETIGRNIPNTPMLGALARVRPDLVGIEGAQAAVRATLGGKLSEAVLQSNYQAIERAYEEVQTE